MGANTLSPAVSAPPRLGLLAILLVLALAGTRATGAVELHTIISTDCSPYSDWMSEGVIYSHFTSNTPGWITRISSCDDPGYEHPVVWHPRMKLQITPNFAQQTSPNGQPDNYVIYNKPMGIEYWLNDQGRDLHPDTVIVMVDTDMLLNINLEHAFQDIATGQSVVQHGTPAAQIYLIGGQWFNQHNCLEMMRAECGDACVDTTSAMVEKYYMVGAPYAMTKGDWMKMIPFWTKYTLRVRQVAKGWADDMSGYVLACMHFGLRHRTTTALMVSAPDVEHAEGWHYIPGLDPKGTSLKTAESADHYVPNFAADGWNAPILHYCQFADMSDYDVGTTYAKFGKYEFDKIPQGLPDCSPLPKFRYDLAKVAPHIWNESHPLKIRKRAYIMWHVPRRITDALEHYRLEVCGEDYTAVAAGADGGDGGARKAVLPSGSGRPLFGTKAHRNRRLDTLQRGQ